MAANQRIAAALHVGINAYPGGNRLKKCVADAKAMRKLFGGELLLDREATRKNIMAAIKATVLAPKKGEWAVITYSGHGTQVPDENGDEPDGWDEAVVDVNLDVILDDEFQSLLRGRHRQARILVICDSCYSGTIHRAAPLFSSAHLPALRRENARYMPYSTLKPKQRAVTNVGPQRALPNVPLVSGCADFELSYEGRNCGVLSGAIYEKYKPTQTIGQLAKLVGEAVDASGYPQHPQLTCSRAALKWKVPRID